MRIEREERLSLITGLKCWYRKQIFLSQCTSVGDGLRVGPDPIRVFRGTTAKLEIGEGVVIYTPCEFVITTHVFQGSAIKIGPNTRVGKNCAIRAALYVEIGEGCLIAPWVRIADYNGHPIQPGDGRIGAPTPPDEVGPVIIGDNVWIGENAFIQKGVTIGRDSVVGANSVVTRNVPEGTVVMGIPARVATRLADLERVEKAVVKASTSSSSRDER
jgi:acetyltransferase-like isoleucine patch superfamily enzyme